jgi:hypothetical protein
MRDSGELELKIIVQQRINGKISAKFVQSLFAKSQLCNGGTGGKGSIRVARDFRGVE